MESLISPKTLLNTIHSLLQVAKSQDRFHKLYVAWKSLSRNLIAASSILRRRLFPHLRSVKKSRERGLLQRRFCHRIRRVQGILRRLLTVRILKLFSNACQKLDFSKKVDTPQRGREKGVNLTRSVDRVRRSESPDTKVYRSILAEHDKPSAEASNCVLDKVMAAPIRKRASFGAQEENKDTGEEKKGRMKGLSMRKSLSFH
jgi:hypothetical protein